jgi:sugar lactone lactonase YvrE
MVATVTGTLVVATATPAAAAQIQAPVRGPVDRWLVSSDSFVNAAAVDGDDNLWLADLSHDRFEVVTTGGQHVEYWGSSGTGPGQFKSPWDLTFAPDGSFYVAERQNFRVQKFDANRNFLLQWGTQGDGDGQFRAPEKIELDSSGNVYVKDGKRNNVQVFTSAGVYLRTIAQVPDTGGIGVSRALAVVDDRVYATSSYEPFLIGIFDLDGTQVGEIGYPGNAGCPTCSFLNGANLDSLGNLYIGGNSGDGHYAARVRPDGYVCEQLRWSGLSGGHADFMASDAAGNVYFASNTDDGEQHEIVKFAPATGCSDATMIQGTVTDAATGDPIPAATVRVYPAVGSGTLAATTTDQWGRYALRMPVGDYRLRVVPPAGHASVWWTSTTPDPWWSAPQRLTNGGDIRTGPNQQIVHADFAAPPSNGLGTLTGSVTNGVSGLPGIRVQIYTPNGLYGLVLTKANGSFQLADIPPGTYRVKFLDVTGTYQPEWWDGAPNYFTADDIAVTSGSTTPVPEVVLTT